MKDKEDFEQYLHLRRWTDKEKDPERIKSFDETQAGPAFRKMWIEQALTDIERYEKQHPEWIKLGDEEQERFWKR